MLTAARRGIYGQDRLRETPARMIAEDFVRLGGDSGNLFRIGEPARSMVSFARLNLLAPWPMRGPFDVIFCRNVMIYFEKSTRQQVIERFWEILAPGGVLFIGHSESLIGIRHRFRYLEPTVYQKA
jgi:chemotaxis protein methyltransferase CheR